MTTITEKINQDVTRVERPKTLPPTWKRDSVPVTVIDHSADFAELKKILIVYSLIGGTTMGFAAWIAVWYVALYVLSW